MAQQPTKQPAMFAMQVIVPENVQPGWPVQVQTPSGMFVKVIIPPGLLAGDSFQVMVPQTTRRERREQLAASFRAFDIDASGTLSASELRNILTRQGGGYPLSIADADEIIATFDRNGDGERFAPRGHS
jgi:hypothetical protein